MDRPIDVDGLAAGGEGLVVPDGVVVVPDAPSISYRVGPIPTIAPGGLVNAPDTSPTGVYVAALNAFYDAAKDVLAKHAIVHDTADDVALLETRLRELKAELVKQDADLASADHARLEALAALNRAHIAAGLPQAPPVGDQAGVATQ